MILIRTFDVEEEERNQSRTQGSESNTSGRCSEHTRLRTRIKHYLIRSTPEVLNLLTHITWQSYSYFFFKYIVGISSSSFGILYFIFQITKAIVIVLVHYFRGRVFAVSRRLSLHGEDKTLHVFGSVGVLVFWPFVLAPCIGCVTDSPEGILVAAYTFPVLLYSASVTLLETSRWLGSSLKSTWSHASHQKYTLRSCSRKSWLGIALHAVTWIFLAHDNGREITSKTQTPFSHQTIFILAVGFFATFLYQVASDDSTSKRRERKRRKRLEQERLAVEESQSKNENHTEENQEQQNKQPEVETNHIDTKKAEESIPSSATASVSRPPSPPPSPPLPPPLPPLPELPTHPKPGIKPWKQRLQNLEYLQSIFIYILSANSFNVALLILPVYLMEALRFDKFSAAYFPAVVYGGWGLGTLAARKLIDVSGYKVLFCVTSFVTFLTSVWFFAQSVGSKYVMYLPALIFGFSSCLAVITSQMMIILQSRATKECPVGVDDFTSTIEALINGIVVLIIMQLYPGNPQERSVDQFLRLVMFLVPALHLAVALVETVYYIHPPLPLASSSLGTESQGEEMKIRTIRLNISTIRESGKEEAVSIAEVDLKVLKDLPSTDV